MDENERGLSIANEFLDVARKASEWMSHRVDDKNTEITGTPLVILLGAISGVAQLALLDQHYETLHRTAAVAAVCAALCLD